jgi:predicted NodU family carbamoyl transferase
MIDPHLGYAASAFLLFPFKQAAILIVDDNGGYAGNGVETISYGISCRRDIEFFKQVTAIQ